MSAPHRRAVARPQECSWRLGQLSQAGGDRACLVELAERHQRLHELRRDREDGRVLDPLALRVLPDRAQVLDRLRRLVREQRHRAARQPRLERLPDAAGRLCDRDRLLRPRRGVLREPAAGGERARDLSYSGATSSSRSADSPTRRGGARRRPIRPRAARARTGARARARTRPARRARPPRGGGDLGPRLAHVAPPDERRPGGPVGGLGHEGDGVVDRVEARAGRRPGGRALRAPRTARRARAARPRRSRTARRRAPPPPTLGLDRRHRRGAGVDRLLRQCRCTQRRVVSWIPPARGRSDEGGRRACAHERRRRGAARPGPRAPAGNDSTSG